MYVCNYCFQWTSKGTSTCYLGILPSERSLWTLGSYFIAKYYTIFRYKGDKAQVAFADKN